MLALDFSYFTLLPAALVGGVINSDAEDTHTHISGTAAVRGCTVSESFCPHPRLSVPVGSWLPLERPHLVHSASYSKGINGKIICVGGGGWQKGTEIHLFQFILFNNGVTARPLLRILLFKR